MSDDKMREAFERWMEKRGCRLDRMPESVRFVGCSEAAYYYSVEHNNMLRAWQAALAAQPRVTVDEVAAIATETWQNYITAKVAVGEEFGIHNGMLHVAQALRNAFPHMFRG